MAIGAGDGADDVYAAVCDAAPMLRRVDADTKENAMKTMLLMVVCVGGLAMSHRAVADPDRLPPPAPLPEPPDPTEPPTANPMPPPMQEPVAPAPTTVDPMTTLPAPIPITSPDPVAEPPVAVDQLVLVDERPTTYAWREPRLATGIGVGLTIGGGVTGFTDKAMRDTVSSQVSGLWDFRATIGTHVPIGLDLTYLGSAANVSTLAGANNGTLLGTTVEAALRYNILPHRDWNPYLFAGVGWQRYDVRHMSFATSDTGLQQKDNFLEIPMGAGLGYRHDSGVTVDLRGTFRAATSSTLVLEPNGVYADLHSWEASGAVGYEF